MSRIVLAIAVASVLTGCTANVPRRCNDPIEVRSDAGTTQLCAVAHSTEGRV